MCAALEGMGKGPTELDGAASLELGEVSSDASGEGRFSSTFSASALSLLDSPKSLDPSTPARPQKISKIRILLELKQASN